MTHDAETEALRASLNATPQEHYRRERERRRRQATDEQIEAARVELHEREQRARLIDNRARERAHAKTALAKTAPRHTTKEADDATP